MSEPEQPAPEQTKPAIPPPVFAIKRYVPRKGRPRTPAQQAAIDRNRERFQQKKENESVGKTATAVADPASLPDIVDDKETESPIEGLAAIEPPEGYAYGKDFLSIVPLSSSGPDDDEEGVERAPTARDQATLALKAFPKDAIPQDMLNLPLRMHLTDEDFGLDVDRRELAALALAGDRDAFASAARALYLFILLMPKDTEARQRVNNKGLPSRQRIKLDDGSFYYSQPKTYKASRWEIDAYASYGVTSGMRPLPGYWEEVARAGWLTHILPRLQFINRPDNLPTVVDTPNGQKAAAKRLDPKRSRRRELSLQWLEKAAQYVDSKLSEVKSHE